jgi:hypothetical protein
MTTYMPLHLKCAVCGRKSTHSKLSSTNTMGPPDLDLRPAEMKRSTMEMWVQKCPHCGYCATPIDKEREGAREVMGGDRYRELSQNQAYPELARNFLCASLILESAGEYVEAAWQSLYAAWTCDDGEKEELAKDCRLAAFQLFSRARDRGERILEDEGAEELVLADILRRSGSFDHALRLCEEGMRKSPDRFFSRLLKFERSLIKRKGTGLYRVEDAIPASELCDR